MTWRIEHGDCISVLRTLPDASAHCCVCSPPYWGLRDYGTGEWIDGDSDCDHKGMPLASSSSSLAGYTSESVKLRTFTVPFKEQCRKCGARRVDQQIGLERTPDEYVDKLVEVFREVRRVLRDDGTLWLNLGDSYNAYNGNAGPGSSFSAGSACDTQRPKLETGHALRTKSLKPKDLVGIPWRVAFALQADGWWLRSDIIWSKPNPMPESVRDRPTKAREYVFLLAKSERYYFDADAVRKPYQYGRDHTRHVDSPPESHMPGAAPSHTGLRRSGNRARVLASGDNGKRPGDHLGSGVPWVEGEGRNVRSVWGISTQPFAGAHFATMPPALAERCIKAGCPVGGTVIDPFAGAGTTLLVADRLGRNGIGIELNPEYAALARERIYNDAPLLHAATEATA